MMIILSILLRENTLQEVVEAVLLEMMGVMILIMKEVEIMEIKMIEKRKRKNQKF